MTGLVQSGLANNDFIIPHLTDQKCHVRHNQAMLTKVVLRALITKKLVIMLCVCRDTVIMRTEYINAFPKEWEPAARVFSALGDTTRQQILLLFEPGEALSIKDVSSMFPLGRSTIVHHLSVLENAGVLSMRRQGRETLYSIVYEQVLDSLERLRLFIENEMTILSDNAEAE